MLRDDMLVVLDFSAIANIDSIDLLKTITELISSRNIKVAVTKGFYENYDVVMKSQNEEQKAIAKRISGILSQLSRKDRLIYASKIIDPKEIVNTLCGNEKVCLFFFEYSEFAESVLRCKDSLKCKAIIVDETGDLIIFDEDARGTIVDGIGVSVDESVLDDGHFNVSFEAEKGKTVTLRDNQNITLGELIGCGGEGSVYNCDYKTDYVVKIYRKEQLTRLRLKKLSQMEQKQVRYDGVCWPEKMVYSVSGEPVGYLMKKHYGKSLAEIFDGSDSVMREFPDWHKQDLVSLAIDILERIQYLHLFGILIGDLRLKNIVVGTDGVPVLVDIDSCQINNLPCPAGYPDYTPPELQGVEFKKQLRTYDNESFACAVLVFRILFCGIHPYDQKNGADTIEEEISSNSFPYPKSGSGDLSRIPWGDYDQMWRYTPIQLQSFFFDFFKNGKRYTLQEIILMLKTYHRFIELNKEKMPEINSVAFDYN